jgi:hypothetical protein
MGGKRRRRGERRTGLPWAELYPTLDLHGETAESARARAEGWLREQQAAGVDTVRVVTGRGLHSVGPPVLPGEVADLLDRLRGSVVARAEREHGGGAFRIDLRRLRAARRPGTTSSAPDAPATLAPVDPELRRRAEESLAELGIVPTAELIAAEMRRLAGGG